MKNSTLSLLAVGSACLRTEACQIQKVSHVGDWPFTLRRLRFDIRSISFST